MKTIIFDNNINSNQVPVRWDDLTLSGHVRICGQSGSGKSMFLAKLLKQQQLALSAGNLQGIVNTLPIGLPALLRKS